MKGKGLWKLVRHRACRREIRTLDAITDWVCNSKTGTAPHAIKQATLRSYAKAHALDTLIETGTYHGYMIDALLPFMSRIISIELDTTLAREAQHRFADVPSVSIHQGDSGDVLGHVLRSIDRPCLFWLDAHYSGGITAKAAVDTPIGRELQTILEHTVENHVILIDDAREFDGKDGYPSLSEVEAIVRSFSPGWTIRVEDDIIRIHTPGRKV